MVEEDDEDEEEGVVMKGEGGIQGICIGVWIDLLL